MELQEKLVATITAATDEVFNMMLGIALEREQHHIETGDGKPFDGIISLIGLAGSWVGAGRIACSAGLACRLSGALLASEYTSVNEEVLDAMAEITNMIIGNVKSTLEEELGPMGLSIPTVIFGRNYQARSSGVKEWVVVPFRCGEDEMEVKLALMPAGRPDAQRMLAMHEVG